jgi:hypothetical protein
MPLAQTSERIAEDSRMQQHVFVGRSGKSIAWLTIGDDGELGVYGSPEALRRLAAALVIAAEAAAELDQPGGTARAVA